MHYSTLYIFISLSLFIPSIFAHSHHTGPIVLIIGTRPEGIKMIPVYRALKEAGIPTVLCSTEQHIQLLNEVLEIFDVQPDVHLNIMKPNQDLFYITTAVLNKMKDFLEEIKPSLVLVQGDTTSAMAAALASFYLKIPVGHVEAGLRTGNIYAPYPEEMNRSFISLIATYHFAPTHQSVENLLKENIHSKNIFCVGNTVVDALHTVQNKIQEKNIRISPLLENTIQVCKQNNKKIMLLTAHRRESFNGGIKNIFQAVEEALQENPNLYVIYPMHPNPIIKATLQETTLEKMPNILITQPLGYSDLVYLLSMVDLVATDSGGIQEEAVSLGKQVLVLRNETDRPEGVECGIAKLVGTDKKTIIQSIEDALQNHRNTSNGSCVYGNGTAAQQIVEIIKNIKAE